MRDERSLQSGSKIMATTLEESDNAATANSRLIQAVQRAMIANLCCVEGT